MTKTAFPTTEAFRRLLSSPDLWRRTGRPMRQRYTLRTKLKCRQTISLKLKMQILMEAGYSLKQEAIWQLSDTIPDKISTTAKVKNCKKTA